MAGGFAVTKEPGTDLFAARFHDSGFSVLAFDYRHLGESGGQPRQVVRVREQLADWDAAVGFAATLPGVDPARLAIWAFSASGGYVFPLAARDTRLAAAIAQTPNADNPAAARNAARYQEPRAMLRFTGRALLDSAWRPGRPAAAAGAAGRDAGDGRGAHHARRARQRPRAQPGRPVSGLAAGGGGAFGAAADGRPARPLGLAGAVPAAGRGVRPGPVRAGRARDPGRGAGARGRADPAAGRALRAVPGRPRAGRGGRAVLPAAGHVLAADPRSRSSS